MEQSPNQDTRQQTANTLHIAGIVGTYIDQYLLPESINREKWICPINSVSFQVNLPDYVTLQNALPSYVNNNQTPIRTVEDLVKLYFVHKFEYLRYELQESPNPLDNISVIRDNYIIGLD